MRIFAFNRRAGMRPYDRWRITIGFGVVALMALLHFPVAAAQQKMDADDSDVAALLQKVTLAHQQEHPELRSGTDYEKRCDKGKGYGSEGPSEICSNAWASHRINTEILLLKGCSYPPDGPPKHNPCEFLAEFYLKQGRYIEGLAALRLPNSAQADEDRSSDTRLGLYEKLGNRAKQKEERAHQCHDLADDISCQILNEDYGEHVNIEDARNRAADRKAQDSADAAQEQADKEQQQRDKANIGDAIVEGVREGIQRANQNQPAPPPPPTTSATPVRKATSSKPCTGNAVTEVNPCSTR
jgi:hypothetical protein